MTKNNNTFTGTVEYVSPIETVGAKQFKKGYFNLIETEGEYPQSISITAFGDKSEELKKISEGSVVTAQYNIKVTEYNGKHYNNINLWKLDVLSEASQTPTIEESDLPF